MKVKQDIITGTEKVVLENGTVINRYSHVVAGAEIGKECMIGSFCYIAGDAVIGDNVRIQNGNSIWDGVTLCSKVFVGPNCTFTNHHNPHERHDETREYKPDFTVVCEGATICAACVIIAPRAIGMYSRIGAGSTVLRDVKDHEKANGLIK